MAVDELDNLQDEVDDYEDEVEMIMRMRWMIMFISTTICDEQGNMY